MPSTARAGKHCSQCGQPFSARACGPTHAVIHAEAKAARAGKGKTVKAWAVIDESGNFVDYDQDAPLVITRTRIQAKGHLLQGRRERVVPVEVRILSEGSR